MVWDDGAPRAGGLHLVTMADGSVQFVKTSVGIATWRALGTRNGGEVLGSDNWGS